MAESGGRKRWTRKKRMLTVGGAIVVTSAVVLAFFATRALIDFGRFDQTIDAECAPLVVLAFRGSGEANLNPEVTSNAGAPYRYGDSDLVTNGWEGITLDGLFEQLAHTTYEGFDADQIPVVPIGPAGTDEPFGYDAIDAITEASSIDSALTFSGSSLLYSATRGAEAATHLIHDYLERSEGCPITPEFVVVGFSQGAMAARHTAELNPDSVAAVIKIGDPYQMPEARGVRSEGASGIGIIRWKADDKQRTLLDAYYDSFDFTSAICHAADPICEFEPLSGLFRLATGMYGEHLDYYSDAFPEEAEEDALVIAKLAHERWQKALDALDAGESVNWAEANNRGAELRSVSMSIAGTPTLFSALTPDLVGSGATFQFDVDGDGVYETDSDNGTVWVTFDDDEPRRIGVKVTDPRVGTTTETTHTVTPSPREGTELTFTRDGELIDTPSDTPVEPTPTAPPVPPVSNAAPAPTVPPAPAPPARPAPTPGPATVPPPAPPAPDPVPDDDDPGTEDPDTEDPGDQDPGGEDPGGEDPGDQDPGGGDPGDQDPGGEDPGGEDPANPDPDEEAPDDDEPGQIPRLDMSFPLSAGEAFDVVGSGFAPSTRYEFRLANGQTVPIVSGNTVETDEQGEFAATLWLPEETSAGEVFMVAVPAGETLQSGLWFTIFVSEPEAPVPAEVIQSSDPAAPGEAVILTGTRFDPLVQYSVRIESLGIEELVETDESGGFVLQVAIPADAALGHHRVEVIRPGQSINTWITVGLSQQD